MHVKDVQANKALNPCHWAFISVPNLPKTACLKYRLISIACLCHHVTHTHHFFSLAVVTRATSLYKALVPPYGVTVDNQVKLVGNQACLRLADQSEHTRLFMRGT